MKVAINGFGRIGRLFLRKAFERSGIEVVAINDLAPPDNLAYLLRHDSTHGKFPDRVSVNGNVLSLEHTYRCSCDHFTHPVQKIQCSSIKDPAELPWKELGVDVVVDCTGVFTDRDSLGRHLQAGARKVILSAPAKGDGVKTIVMGVNDSEYDPANHYILSNASCTTNGLAPIVKVLLKNFGIEEGLMTTVHAVTASQPTVDGTSKKDWRGGRGAFQNIIPSSTGAAKAVALVLPEVKGKLTGMSMRVPVADVSVVDLTVRLTKSATIEEINAAMRRASETDLCGILGYTDEEVVSTDFIGDTRSSIYDSKASLALNDRFVKLISWYDNEMGYSTRMVDLAELVAK